MFDVNMPVVDEEEGWLECGEEYREGLFAEFVLSPEGVACEDRLGGLGWADSFLDFGLQYLGDRPQDLSLGGFDEIVFDLFPRKVSVEPEAAEDIVDELRAFWSFLARQYNVPNAPAMLARLDAKAIQRLKRELSNPQHFGMAKSLAMMGKELGFDMTSQEGLDRFMNHYNATIARSIPVPKRDDDDLFDPIPNLPAMRDPKQRKPLLPPMSADERRAFSRDRKKRLKSMQSRKR